MGQPVPGTEEQDLRLQRLERWLDQHDSPLYVALAPFNPLRDKADAVGTLLGGSDNVIEGLVGRFPALANITDLTAQSVTTVVLKRMHGRARWTASNSLRQQVLAAASEANAEKALGLLAARYAVTDRLIRESPFSQEVDKYLKSGMAQVEEMKALRITGSRTVALELTTTARVKPKLLGLLTSGTGTGLNVGMLWFNVIALKAAYNSLQKSNAPEYTLGFAASIFGVIGAAAAALVGARATQKLVALKLKGAMPGVAFGNGLIQFLTRPLFARVSGYPAILLGFFADIHKFRRQTIQGNAEAGEYTLYGGISVGLGAILTLEGSLAIAGPTALIPFAGWGAAAVVILGGALISGGLYLQYKAHEKLHNPIELWAARCVFGNRGNDGEPRPDTPLDFEKKLPFYGNITEEISAWYASYYLPRLLSREEAKKLNLEALSSGLTRSWSEPDWKATLQGDMPRYTNTLELTILLPGFMIEHSAWQFTASTFTGDITSSAIVMTPACYLTQDGLAINFKHKDAKHVKTTLEITYQPGTGPDSYATSTTKFSLGD
ncbi:hypothetical protein F3J44_29665 [Pantoea sp. Tr-811]|nr:hypothetical protein [Pantoea sp. Tr-811]